MNKPDQKVFTNQQKKDALESSLYYLTTQQPFYGSFLQEITVSYTEALPTAAIGYDKKKDEFRLYLNPNFFCSMSLEQRIAILFHEVLHFSHGHIFRGFQSAKDDDGKVTAEKLTERQIENIAADMAINQYIQNLPEECIMPEKFKDDKGNPFPLFRTFEEYYELLKKHKDNKHNKDKFTKYKVIDEHNWEQLSEEEKQRMLEEAKKVLQRTVEKTSYSHSSVPDAVKDMLNEIEQSLVSINYKEILRQAIKRSMSQNDRTNSWNRRNKRYGNYAPGSCADKLPKLNIYIDSSGSISYNEMNAFCSIMNGFLKVGSKTCNLGMWHTDLYSMKPYKRNMPFNENEIQSGGTDVSCVLANIKKVSPDLSIILTDGYFDSSDIKVTSQVVWIISKGGNPDHPMKHLGKTIPLDKIVD